MGNFYMESTQINYRRDEKLKTVDQKLQELSETSAIDTDIAPVFKSTNTYQPGDMVYYRNKLYVFNVEHTGTWAAADVTATDVTTTMNAGFDSLKSGLTNYETQNNINLEVPDRKNLIALTVAGLKSLNTDGTWSGNDYTHKGITYTIQTDSDNNVIGINVNGTATSLSSLNLNSIMTFDQNMILSGCAVGGGNSVYKLLLVRDTGASLGLPEDYGDGASIQTNAEFRVQLRVYEGQVLSNKVFTPMIRPATITDPTFAPYIPSVESRIEAVESAVQTKTSIASASIDGSNAVEINVANLTSYDFVVCGVSYYDTGIANYGFVMIPVTEFLLFSDSGTKIFFSKTGGGVSFVDVKSDNNRTKLTFTPESGVTPTGRYYFVHGIKTR